MRSWTVAAVVVAVLGAGTVVARPVAAESSPAKWDPRVTKYVTFVERHRKLEFEHPVPVKFLADKAFVKAYQGDDPKITKKDRAEAEHFAGQLRALGLVEGPVDLIQSGRDLGATDTVGFYDQEKKELFVRGTDLDDVDVRITLVHELTHALQDQHFDLTKLDDKVETSGEDFALTALVEGDATSVEDDYLYSLPKSEQDAYFAEEPDDTVDSGTASTADIPPVLDLFQSAPYVFGPRYIEVLRNAGGVKRVNQAFTTPPTSEEEIIDPLAARERHAAKRVPAPKLAAGERRDGDADDFGALSLYFVLASRLDPQVALKAAEGWGGDRYVAFTKRDAGDKECVRIAFVGDTGADTKQIADALGQWAAALPAGAASSQRAGERAILTACDTAGTTAPEEATLDDAVTLLVDRNDLALQLLYARAPARIARCSADQLAAEPDLVALFGKDEAFTASEQDKFDSSIRQAVAACRTS
jgi:hypothetical protein